jgi:hypothetical protein
LECPLIFYTDVNQFICKICFPSAANGAENAPTYPRTQEAPMTHRTIALLIPLALGLLMAPLLAEAQPVGKTSTNGMVNISSATAIARPIEVFTQALRELGYMEGQHLAIARRYADGRPERLPALTAEFATRHVDVFLVLEDTRPESYALPLLPGRLSRKIPSVGTL